MKPKHFLLSVLILVGVVFLMGGCGGGGKIGSTAPTVVSVSPANNSTGVLVNSPIIVTFSEEMDQSAAEAAFSLSASPPVSGTFSWSSDGTVLTFTPAAALTYAETYTVAVGLGTQDLAGNPIASTFSSIFTIEETVGTLDTGFDTDGFVVHGNAAVGNDYDYGYAITTDIDGKILVAGSSSNGTNEDMVIWRYR